MPRNLFVAGSNSYGQLGLGNTNDEASFVLVPPFSDSNVIQVSYGGNHCVAVCANGDCFVVGSNSNRQLGIDTEDKVLEWKLHPLCTQGVKIAEVACGWEHTILRTTDGKAYLFGDNTYGQLGFEGKQLRESVVKVAAGLRHSILATESGRIFGFGANRHGQLNKQSCPVLPLTEILKIDASSKIQISCGQFHTVILADKKLYSFGNNKNGQLPVDTETISATPIKIGCGWNASFVLYSDHSLRIYGKNTHGQIGCPDVSARVHLIEGIADFAVGSEHGVALTTAGQLLSWGWNEHGNCGVDSEGKNIYDPTQVKLAWNGNIVGLFAGQATSCFLVDCDS